MVVVQEGRALFERDIWLHAPQVAARLVVSRVARQLGCHQVVPPEKAVMGRSYPGWGLKTFGRCHPCRGEIRNWRTKGKKAIFGTDASAWSDYEAYWKTALHRIYSRSRTLAGPHILLVIAQKRLRLCHLFG